MITRPCESHCTTHGNGMCEIKSSTFVPIKCLSERYLGRGQWSRISQSRISKTEIFAILSPFHSTHECVKRGKVRFVFFVLCWPWQEACSFVMTNVRDAVRSWVHRMIDRVEV
jgi:hypothetical protein